MEKRISGVGDMVEKDSLVKENITSKRKLLAQNILEIWDKIKSKNNTNRRRKTKVKGTENTFIEIIEEIILT